jgi:hypothetical protein
MQYIKDNTGCFNDYLPFRNWDWKLKHVKQRLSICILS